MLEVPLYIVALPVLNGWCGLNKCILSPRASLEMVRNVVTVKELLGHSSLSVTMRYALIQTAKQKSGRLG